MPGGPLKGAAREIAELGQRWNTIHRPPPACLPQARYGRQSDQQKVFPHSAPECRATGYGHASGTGRRPTYPTARPAPAMSPACTSGTPSPTRRRYTPRRVCWHTAAALLRRCVAGALPPLLRSSQAPHSVGSAPPSTALLRAAARRRSRGTARRRPARIDVARCGHAAIRCDSALGDATGQRRLNRRPTGVGDTRQGE